MDHRIRLLRQSDFFREADSTILASIAQECTERELAAGELLCTAGDPGDSLWVLTAGLLEIFRDDVVLDTSGPGECLGEMSVLTGEGRAASVRAAKDSTVLVVPRAVFRNAFERHSSLAWDVTAALAARARASIDARVLKSHSHRLMEDAFARLVSRSVLDEILQQSDPVALLEGRTLHATVLFADLRGFTTMSEGLAPREIVRILNEYLSAMVDTVLDAGGTLDKFVGDGLLAHFGVPLAGEQDARRAVSCAGQMLERLAELNKTGRFVSQHPLDVGIGLASGEVVAGYVGNARHMEYTAIGDIVNLAARLESLTKLYGVSVLACAATARGDESMRRIDRVRVRGRSSPTDLHALILEQDRAPRDGMNLAEAHEAGLLMQEQGRFDEAAAHFEALSRRFPHDAPSRLLADRCRELAKSPPPSWDGVFALASK